MPAGFSGVTQIPNFTWDQAVVAATTAGVTALTGPSSGTYEIIAIHLSAQGANAATCNVQIVPSGGTAGVTHALYFAVDVAANGTTTLHNYGAPLAILNASETLQFDASANDRINAWVIYKIWG